MSRKKLIILGVALLVGYLVLSLFEDDTPYYPNPYYGQGWNPAAEPQFHSNPHVDTAISTSGDSGYISCGDGTYVSW